MTLYRLDQTLGKPGAWMVNTENEKQRLTVVVRLSRLESQVTCDALMCLVLTTRRRGWGAGPRFRTLHFLQIVSAHCAKSP